MPATSDATESAQERPSERPKSVVAIAAILLFEAVGIAAVGLWTAVQSFSESGMHIAGTLFLALICFGGAAFLYAAAKAMLAGNAWSRGATLAWQVLQVGVSFGTYNGAEGPVPLALLLFIPAIVALVLVFRKSVTAWLRREDRQLP